MVKKTFKKLSAPNYYTGMNSVLSLRMIRFTCENILAMK